MLLVSFTFSAQTQPVPTEVVVVRWLTYVDPRFDVLPFMLFQEKLL